MFKRVVLEEVWEILKRCEKIFEVIWKFFDGEMRVYLVRVFGKEFFLFVGKI